MYTLNCNGKPFSMNRVLIMGILNYTEDSFYGGSRLHSDDDVINKARQMTREGADIIDIGAQSTRPGSKRVSAADEIRKIVPLIRILKNESSCLISVDTYHAEVAAAAVEAGADMINDISGGTMDEEMIATVGRLKVPYILMHIKGTPEVMQQKTHYDNILKELLEFFIAQIEKCRLAGICDIMIDPGFGFAKTPAQNLYLLKHLSVLKILDKPIMAGLSRKSTIYRTLGITAEEALNGTSVLNTIALLNGAQLLRVHDVKEAVEVRKLVEAYSMPTLQS